MDVRCTNKECLHEWNYRGRLGDNDYITCAKCRYKSLIKKAKLSEKSTDLLTDLPTKKQYTKVVKQKETDFVIQESQKRDKLMTFNDGTQVLIPRPEILVPMFENCSLMNEELEENLEEESNSHFSELPTNFCEEHGLHAHYDSLEKKWLCGKCPESQIEINRHFKKYTKNLGTATEIEKPNLKMREVGFDPLKTLNNQMSLKFK